MTRTELVVSELLMQPIVPAPAAGAFLRGLGLVERSPDYLATVAAGHLETDVDAWYATVRIEDADWQERLALAACWAHVILAHRVAQLEAAVKAAR